MSCDSDSATLKLKKNDRQCECFMCPRFHLILLSFPFHPGVRHIPPQKFGVNQDFEDLSAHAKLNYASMPIKFLVTDSSYFTLSFMI